MNATELLIRAAARFDTDARLARAPSDQAILAGLAAIEAPIPADARDAARRHLAIATWLRAWAVHEDPERAAVLEERATAQDVMAALRVATGERHAA